MDLIQLKDIAIQAALSAGKVIQKYMDDDVLVEEKQGGSSYASQVVTAVDRECESAILSFLIPTRKEYNLGLLTEESEDDGSRFLEEFFWCIDPMDGTLAFINKRAGFSVSIALIAKDGTPIIGVVYDPRTNSLYHAIKGKGAYKNEKPWTFQNKNEYLTYVTDKKLKDTLDADIIVRLLDEKVRNMGLKDIKEITGAGAVMNAIIALENGPACMIKLPKKENGGGSIWDYAATACIYHEIGMRATNYKGGKLDLNRKDSTFMNHEGIYYAYLMNDK